jgi:hypothetical protein
MVQVEPDKHWSGSVVVRLVDRDPFRGLGYQGSVFVPEAMVRNAPFDLVKHYKKDLIARALNERLPVGKPRIPLP